MTAKNKFAFLIFLLALFFAFLAQAEIKTVSEEINGVIVSRLAPDTAYLGQKIWITLVLENNSSVLKTITLKENLGDADFEKTETKKIETEYGETFWYYEWKIQLKAGENTSVSYWLVPEQIGLYTISPAKITIGGENYNLESRNIDIWCLADEKCDISAGENYLNCPYDCSTGLGDNLCDMARDGKCDPDCEKGADADCEKSSAKSPNYIYFLAAIIIIIALLIAIIIKKKILNKER